jgi:hypothetical protein
MAAESMDLAMLVGVGTEAKGLSAETRDEAIAAIERALEEEGSMKFLRVAAESVLKGIATQLQVPLANVLKEGWKQDTELRERIAGDAGKPAPSGQVSLYDHKVTGVLRPTAQVIVNGRDGPKVEFVVRTTLTLKAAFLVVKNATITAIKGGEIAAKCEVFYVSRRGGKETEYPVMRTHEKTFKSDTEFALPAGGLRIV